jgi:hypothetical protein
MSSAESQPTGTPAKKVAKPMSPKQIKSVAAVAAKAIKSSSVAATPAKKAAAGKAPAVKKAAGSPKAAKATNPNKSVKPAEPARVELVRDSFTMPKTDFDLIAALKTRAIRLGRPAKKSELLRAGLRGLADLADPALKASLAKLTVLKTGRPKKADSKGKR